MKSRALALGAFVVVAMVLAVVLVTALGKGRWFGGGQTRVVVWFDANVKGLNVGAPVTFRGVPVGQVDTIAVELDPETLRSRIPVTLAVSTDAMSLHVRGKEAQREALHKLIDRGLAARMVTQSLVTGQAMIDLLVADAPAQPLAQPDEGPLRIPQVGGTFDRILEQVSELPLKDTVAQFQATMQSIRALAEQTRNSMASVQRDVGRVANQAVLTTKVAGEDLHRVSQDASATLVSVKDLADQGREMVVTVQPSLLQATQSMQAAAGQVQSGMGELSAWIAPGSPTRVSLDGAVQDLSRSARSFSALVEDLEDQPNALIFGRRADDTR
jgi:paraquat-inducible protein B